MNETLFYRCEKCGNIVALIQSGGGELVCCGQAMTKLQANSTEAAIEKHIPVLTNESGRIKAVVGSVTHPMIAEHYIQWIAIVVGKRIEIVHLKPGYEPKAAFSYVVGEEEEVIFVDDNDEIVPNCEGNLCNFVYNSKRKVTVYAYCNLHGLWKAEL